MTPGGRGQDEPNLLAGLKWKYESVLMVFSCCVCYHEPGIISWDLQIIPAFQWRWNYNLINKTMSLCTFLWAESQAKDSSKGVSWFRRTKSIYKAFVFWLFRFTWLETLLAEFYIKNTKENTAQEKFNLFHLTPKCFNKTISISITRQKPVPYKFISCNIIFTWASLTV